MTPLQEVLMSLSRSWSYRIRELGDEIASLSVEETVQLASYLQEKHGVQPLVVVASTLGGAAAPAEQVSGSGTVWLESYGRYKIKAIKEVRSLTGLGLKDAKQMVESCPIAVLKDATPRDAQAAKEALEAAGATVSIR